MNGNDFKPLLAAALADFAQKPLPTAATAFFNTLGYRSERRLNFPSLAACLAEFDTEGKAAKFFPEASSAKPADPVLVQQLTSEEIAAGSDGEVSLFKPSGLDPRQFESYLFLAVSLPEGDYSRTELANRTRALNSLFPQPVLVLFRHGANISLAITYRRTNKRDQTRDVIERKVTLIKDIVCAQPHRAHLDILAEFSLPNLAEKGVAIKNFADLDNAWRKKLSTQPLNESFYGELSKWYYWATSTIKLPVVPEHLSHRQDAKEENIKQFTIRLLCRSIFCWFLKERGLIAPRLLELADVTGQPVIHTRPAKTVAEFAKSNSYYRGVLQNVFFNCLNTPMDQRRLTAARAVNDKTVKDPQLKKLAYRGKNYLPDDFDFSLFDQIPYLNGGLFDCLPEDNASDTIDDEKISVPNKLFYAEREELKSEKKTIEVSGLNRILERYKFTITENTPLEEEIALDPELLGLVFENLLAEVDVSDEGAAKSARKASGSYYTPRRVIDYMVNESLRLHLEGFCQERGANTGELAALTELIYHDEFDNATHSRLAEWIVEAFDKIRILDPACGSGAFPMGALHRMVDILRRVDPGNERWLHRQVSGIPDTQLRKKAEAELKRHADDYSRKLGLIKNAIYGVDIQPLAVLLTKLRFFISLLVDQKLNPKDAAHNYGLTPLPNLETKVLCANTLRELQVSLFEREAIRRYQSARDEYYQPDTTAARRAELTDEIAAALAELLPSFAKDATGQEIKDRKTQDLRNRELLKEWFRHSSLPAPFFNFSVFFPEVCPEITSATVRGEFDLINQAQHQQELTVPLNSQPSTLNSGFDLVIGNPPYGGTKLPDDVREALALSSKDPYGAFIARFLGDGRRATPLKPDGILAYIVSDTFMTIKTHRPLREQLMGSRVHKMIRCHADTFNAVVNTAVIITQKGGGPGAVAPAEDTLARLWAGPQRGPWCQMVDLTQVSIHKQHERFLTLLFDTAGNARRRDIATESCAAYHYPQALIATNSNLPFFVASPKLFALMNDTTAPVKHEEIGGNRVPVRTVRMNGNDVRLVKLGDIAEVQQGLATGDNDAYLFQNPNAHGSYRSIENHQKFLLTEADLKRIRLDENLRQDVVERGISKGDKKSSRYFGGRYIVPFDKGGESDADEGWMPNFWVATDYFIDWSEWAIKRMATLTIGARDGNSRKELCAVIRNAESYFKEGITYSPTGIYSPSFRRGCTAVFGNKGSTIFPTSPKIDVASLLGVLASKSFKFFLKSFRAHTVESPEQGLVDTQIPFPLADVGQLVGAIISKQKKDARYDYASAEQLEIDRLVYAAYGLNRADIAEVETWYARRYETLAAAQRQNLRRAGQVPAIDGWNVYCDETGHLPCDRAPEMILGAMLVPQARVKPLTLKLRERLAQLGWPRSQKGDWAELKWTKVSPGGLKFYEAALDFFLTEPDLRFRALLAPKSPPPPKLPRPPAGADEPGSPAWEKHFAQLESGAPAIVEHQRHYEAWYYDRYFDLLRETLLPPAHHFIYLDVKDTRGGARIKSLESRLADAHYDWSRSGIVEKVQQIHSDEVLLDQLVDVLLGCVAWTYSTPQRNAGHTPSPAKAALAKKLSAAFGKSDGAIVPKVVIDRSPERSPAA